MTLLSESTITSIANFIEQTTIKPIEQSQYGVYIANKNSDPMHFKAHISFMKCRRLCQCYVNRYLNTRLSHEIIPLMRSSIATQFKFILLIWFLTILVQDEFYEYTNAHNPEVTKNYPPNLLQIAFKGIQHDLKLWDLAKYNELEIALLGSKPLDADYVTMRDICRKTALSLASYKVFKNPVQQNLEAEDYGLTAHELSASLACSSTFLEQFEAKNNIHERLSNMNENEQQQKIAGSVAHEMMFLLLVYASNINLKSKRKRQSYSSTKCRQRIVHFILRGFQSHVTLMNNTLGFLLNPILLAHLRQSDVEALRQLTPGHAIVATDL